MKVGIMADNWKVPAFEKALHAAGIEFITEKLETPSGSTTAIYMNLEQPQVAEVGNLILTVNESLKKELN